MEKPDTLEKVIDQIWIAIFGFKEDGLYFIVQDIKKAIDDFIKNNDNMREKTCPHKVIIDQFNQHLEEHKTGKEFTLKKWQLILAAVAMIISLIIGTLGLVLK